MAQSTLAVAADYADALLTARKAKNWLVGILLVMLLAQLGIFFGARYGQDFVIPALAETAPAPDPAAQDPAAPAETPAPPAETPAPPAETPEVGEIDPAVVEQARAAEQFRHAVFRYITGIINFLGIALAIVLVMDILLIVLIMLVGRLIGVARLTSAWIWTVVLVVLLFPWQAFLNFPHLTQADFRIPGVLYTWAELVQHAGFSTDDWKQAILGWARFVAFPVLALLILLSVHVKSRRGLREALGEAQAAPPPEPEMP